MIEIEGIQLLTTDEVLGRIKVHRRTLDRWVAEGNFPEPRFPGWTRCWLSTSVEKRVRKRFGEPGESVSRERA